jgi:hypothetical protein
MANVESDDIKRGCRSPSSFCSIVVSNKKPYSLVYFIVLYISCSLAFKISKATTTLCNKLMRQLFNIVMGVNIQVVESQDQKRNKIQSTNLISHIAFLVFLFYDIKGTCIQYHEVDNLNIKLF